MRPESDIQQLIQIEGPKWHNILLRNNSGALKDIGGRVVRFGLGNISKKQNETSKSSDLIGVRTFVVTQEMVGQMMGQFTAIEVKAEGWKRNLKDKRENAQQAFIEWVRLRGGVAGFAANEEQYREIMRTRYGI